MSTRRVSEQSAIALYSRCEFVSLLAFFAIINLGIYSKVVCLLACGALVLRMVQGTALYYYVWVF